MSQLQDGGYLSESSIGVRPALLKISQSGKIDRLFRIEPSDLSTQLPIEEGLMLSPTSVSRSSAIFPKIEWPVQAGGNG